MKRTPVKDIASARENIEVITGSRGTRCDLAGIRALQVSNPPTQAEVEFLRAQLEIFLTRIEGT